MPLTEKQNNFLETGVAQGDLSTAIMSDLVDKPESKEVFWQLVEKLMDYFYHHPNPLVRRDLKDLEAQAKFELDGTYNQFGAVKDDDPLRKVMLLPDKLLVALIRVYGSSLPVSQKEFQKGMWKRYPSLRTSHQY